MAGLERERWLEPLISVVASVMLYQLSMLYFVFTVPLHMLAMRRDRKSFLAASGLVLLAVIVQETVQYLQYGFTRQDALIIAIGLYGPVVLLAGMVWFHLLLGDMAKITRFISSWILPAVAGFTLLLLYEGEGPTAVYTRDLFREQMGLLLQFGQEIGYGEAFSYFTPEVIYTIIIMVIERGFLPAAVLQMGFALLVAYQIAGRLNRRPFWRFISFRVPETMIWPFLTAWALVLLTSFIELGVIGTLGWNIGLGLAVLYFLQGVAILMYRLLRKGMRIRGYTMVVWSFLALLVPGINVLVMVGMPLFGVSEIWIHYRDVNKEKSNENYS